MRGRRGQALVEFALVLPVLVLLLLAVLDIGRVVFAYTSLTNAAREGVRLAIVNQDQDLIVARAKTQVAIAEVDEPAVTVKFWRPPLNSDPKKNTACTMIAVDCIAQVRFETTLYPITPVIGAFFFPHGVTLAAVSTLPVEYVCPKDGADASSCPRH